jgi:hypothetical protein
MPGSGICNETLHYKPALAIDLEKYEKGAYLIQVTAGNRTFTKMLMKQ